MSATMMRVELDREEVAMAVIEGRTWLEVIPARECEQLLQQHRVGRVALLVDGVPEIFPVNYAIDGHDQVIFRTDKGTKLEAVVRNPQVAFEIDGIDLEAKVGWSVMAVGPAHRVTDPARLRHIATLGLEPWTAGDKAHVVHLAPTKLTGRRIHGPRA